MICCCIRSKCVVDKNYVIYYGDYWRMCIEEFLLDYDFEMNVIFYCEYLKILDKIFFFVYIVIIIIIIVVFLIFLFIYFYLIEEKFF